MTYLVAPSMQFTTATVIKFALAAAQIGVAAATPAAIVARQSILQPCGPGGTCNADLTCVSVLGLISVRFPGRVAISQDILADPSLPGLRAGSLPYLRVQR